MQFLLHMSYKIDVNKWAIKSKEERKTDELRKKQILEEFEGIGR